MMVNFNCLQIYLVGVIACENNRHCGKINCLWNIWKCLQKGLHAWLALGGWGGFPQQQGVVGNHGAEVILKRHRGGSTAWVPPRTGSSHWISSCWLNDINGTVLKTVWKAPILFPQTSGCHFTCSLKAHEWRSYLWVVDSRMLSRDCEDHHSQKLDQVFRGGEGFWETCWRDYSQQLAIKHI